VGGVSYNDTSPHSCVDGYYFLLIVIAQQDASHSPKELIYLPFITTDENDVIQNPSALTQTPTTIEMSTLHAYGVKLK
jgi:hypothetical protein